MRWFKPKPTKSVVTLESISRHLGRVEDEMKRIGYWSSEPPDLQTEVREGRLATYLDAPSFELWLQQVFLPNARQALVEADVPAESSVGVMAMRQYNYHSHVPEAQGLLRLLSEFDRLVETYAHARNS